MCLLHVLIKSRKYTSSKYPYILFKISAEKSGISSVIFLIDFAFQFFLLITDDQPGIDVSAFFEITSLISSQRFLLS